MIGLFSTNHGYIHAIRVNAARWCGERCAGAGVGDGDRCLHLTYTVRCCCLPLPSVPSSGAALLSLFCYTWYCNTCGTVNPKNYHRSPINILNKHLVCWCLGATSCQDTGIRGNNFYCSPASSYQGEQNLSVIFTLINVFTLKIEIGLAISLALMFKYCILSISRGILPQRTQNSHPMAHPQGLGLGCLLWVDSQNEATAIHPRIVSNTVVHSTAICRKSIG